MASNKSIIGSILDIFQSLKLTISLFVILSVTSIIGTVIPQNASPAEYLKFYKESTYKILEGLGFLDMYHTWWFIALLILLCLNLLACSLKNFPRTWKAITRINPVLEDNQVRTLPFVESARMKSSLDNGRDSVSQALKKNFRSPKETVIDGTHHFFAEKAKYSRLGVYVTHVSIFLILGGGLIGVLFGFRGHVTIFEGNTIEKVMVSKKTATYELGFEVRCDDFEVTFYPSGAPQDYKSILTVVEDGKEVLTKTIEVNHPLHYKGIVFYQSSYGTVYDQGGEMTLLAKKKDSTDAGKEYRVEVGKSFTLPDGGPQVTVNRVVPDFALGQNNMVFSRSDQPNNPAAELLLSEGNAPPKRLWVFRNFPDFHGSKELAYQFMFRGFKGTEFTGLQVTKDPGVWVVWTGCTLMVLGILFTFFFSHRRVWVRLTRDGEKVKLVMAGTASKNRLAFEKEFNKLKSEILEG